MNSKTEGLGDIPMSDGPMSAAAPAPAATRAAPRRTAKAAKRRSPQRKAPQARQAAAQEPAEEHGEDAPAQAGHNSAGVNRSPLREPMRQPLRQPMRHSVHDEMSDADIMRMYESEDSDQFYIDPEIEPPHLKYEWKRQEVYGKDDKAYEAELARRGWRAVQASEHPGYFMPKDYSGPVDRLGQRLYAMDKTEYHRRARFQTLKARQAVEDQERQLGIAPPGTGPRDHPRARPTVTKNYEPSLDME